MTKKEAFLNKMKTKEGLYSLIGSFKNEHGEEYVLFKIKYANETFVTGDELDWEIGYIFDEFRNSLSLQFVLNDDEIRQIRQLINKESKTR